MNARSGPSCNRRRILANLDPLDQPNNHHIHYLCLRLHWTSFHISVVRLQGYTEVSCFQAHLLQLSTRWPLSWKSRSSIICRRTDPKCIPEDSSRFELEFTMNHLNGKWKLTCKTGRAQKGTQIMRVSLLRSVLYPATCCWSDKNKRTFWDLQRLQTVTTFSFYHKSSIL